jgi:hypothetical protein
MFSTDQTHLRRYFATLGVAIAAGTLSLAGLFLKLQQDLLVSQSTLASVTPTARSALLRRQEYLSVGTDVLPWFVLVGFLGGAGLSIYGIAGWARRQKVIDEREDIGLRTERVKFLQLTDTEKADKLERDAKESAREITSPVPPPKANTLADVRADIVVIQTALAEKLRLMYSDPVLSSVRVQTAAGQRREIDVLVQPAGADPIAFELKYAPNIANVQKRIIDGLNQLASTISLTGGKGGLVVIVTNEATPAQVARWNTRAKQLANEYDSLLTPYVGRLDDFLALPPNDLAAQLGLRNDQT